MLIREVLKLFENIRIKICITLETLNISMFFIIYGPPVILFTCILL